MLKDSVILLFAFAYLAVLFGIAYYGDKRADTKRSIISNPYIYTLSIAVYCTTWTFYGSVGRAASTGVGFLPIYLGPTLMAALWWFVLRKIIRIAKTQRITSIADFIASRYGKSTVLAGLVTIIAVVGIMPYISLQLKAVSTSYFVLRHYPNVVMPDASVEIFIWNDTALFVALLMAAFAILFGTRHIDVTERHEGMVAAIAFESVIKLMAFLVVGAFVTFSVFDGAGDIFTRAADVPELAALMRFEGIPGGYASWLTLTFLAMMAIVFLPRQFQVAVVENVNEDHIKKAVWLFPLYLLVINLFVLPLAFGGRLLFPMGEVDPDTYVLAIPMAQQHQGLALFVFLGGLSAATSMVIVATIALSTMVCNDLVMPALLRIKALRLTERSDISRLLLTIRRTTIVIVLLMGYLYFRLTAESYALVTIGLVSFAAAAQFAPAILIGMFWKGANRTGAIIGLSAGFIVWAYTLLLPGFARSGWLSMSFIEQGLFGLVWLRPYQLFGLMGFDPITHSVIWSMLANAGLLVVVSMFTRQTPIEQLQATVFVNVFDQPQLGREAHVWRGTASVADLQALVARFLGEQATRAAFENYAKERGFELDKQIVTEPRLYIIGFAERLLAGAIGAASARVVISTIVEGEALTIENVMQILDETSHVMEYSRQLEQKSSELEAATSKLKAANERLQELDRLKDEFVSTVSHELRTPLTSIRSFSEILLSEPDLPGAQREQFLGIVVKETERLTRLIDEVLDLAKIEAGHIEWSMRIIDLCQIIKDAVTTVSQLFNERKIKLTAELPATVELINADRDRLIQVIINLLSNAAKFCEPESGHVSIRLTEHDAQVKLAIADNGPGIEPGHVATIFNKFHQVTTQQTGKPKGTGLGLAITKLIVERHGGRIWVESTPGRGSTFSFVLPKLKAQTQSAAAG